MRPVLVPLILPQQDQQRQLLGTFDPVVRGHQIAAGAFQVLTQDTTGS